MSVINWHVSWVVVILIVVTTCGVIAIYRPRILGEGGQIKLKEGDKLLLECVGNKPLKWIHTSGEDYRCYSHYGRVNTSFTESGFDKRTNQHYNRINLERLAVSDAGSYCCRYKDTYYAEYRDFVYVIVGQSDVERSGKSEGTKAVIFPLLITCVVLLVCICLVCKWKLKRKRIRQNNNQTDGDEYEMERWLETTRDKLSARKPVNLIDLESKVRKPEEFMPISVSNEVIGSKLEFSREHYRMGDQLGAEAFGRIVKAKGVGLNECQSSTAVAVKMIKQGASESQLKMEDGDENEMERCLEKKQANMSVQDSVNLTDLERKLSKHMEQEPTPSSVIDEVISSKWEFPRERLCLGDQLGAGAFGRVFKAEAVGLSECESSTTVAVKMIKQGANESQLNALIVELKVMSKLGSHANIVNFLGACTKDYAVSQELFLIVEYCERGSLLNYIRRHKDRFVNQLNIDHMDNSATVEENPTLTTTDLIQWAFQIARGMEYLASRKVIHGDLATRNVLLTDSNTVKLCDFGLAKELYRDYNYIMSTKSGKFPIKWMAIESIYYGDLSTESDCWSFGVVLWELFSLGKIPYPGIKADEDLINRIDQGYRPGKPEHASSSVYDMMLECWAKDKAKRPTFFELVNRFMYMMGEMLRNQNGKFNAQHVPDNEETKEGFSTGGNIYKMLSITKQDVDTDGYLKPIQLNKSAEPIQNAGPEPQSQVYARGQQPQQKQSTLTPGMINKEEGTNFYVQDPTFIFSRDNNTTKRLLP